MNYSIHLKKHCDRKIKFSYLWIFANELEHIDADIPAGAVVDVYNAQRHYFGKALYNPNSLIIARLLKTDSLPNLNFFYERLKQAQYLRQQLFPSEPAYRLCFGESDFLPGLVIDKYAEYFSIQILSLGMNLFRNDIIQALLLLYPNTQGIIFRSNSMLQEQSDGLNEDFIWGKIPDEIELTENGIHLRISLLEGQKTGYYLDQKLNRRLISEISKNLRVLDCFTNQGGFALNAAKGSAAYVLGIDISEKAIQCCLRNAELNQFNQCHFQVADVFDFLKDEAQKIGPWDMIILDPPSFTKSKKNVNQAIRGYAQINRFALRLLQNNGFLVTASCSHHVYEELFLQTVYDEADRASKQLRLIAQGKQSPDHPIHFSMPESNYLKFFIFQVFNK